MANTPETKVTRREAILTTGKAAVAMGAAVLLPRVSPLDAGKTKHDESDGHKQPAGGLATAAITYAGDGNANHLVDVGLVPIQFVIAPTPAAAGNIDTISVMAVGGSTWVDQGGVQAILPMSFVSGTQVDVGALQAAVRASLSFFAFTVNGAGVTYSLLATGLPPHGPPQEGDNQG